MELNRNWRFHPGDNDLWADPAFDDSKWQVLDPTQDVHYLKQLRAAEIGWFRLQLQVDSSLLNIPLAMTLSQLGASEIYLNGKLIHRLGVVSLDREKEVLFNPNNAPYSLQFTGSSHQVLAVRYSFTKGNPYWNFLGIWGGNPILVIKVMQADVAIQDLVYSKSVVTSRLVGKAMFLFVLALLHLFFYITYPVKRVNLYYSLFTFSLAFGYFLEHVFRFMPREGSSYFIIGLICSLFFAQFMIWGLLAVYSHARQKPGTIFLFLLFCDLLYIISWKWPYEAGYYFFPFFILMSPLDAIRVSLLAIRNKIDGARVVFWGWLGFFVFWALFCLFYYQVLPNFQYAMAITLDLAVFCGAVTFSLVLAMEYAKTKKWLQASLLEVEVERLEAEKMRELEKTKSDLFSNISHEFRTPLTLINGILRKLRKEEERSTDLQEEYGLIQRNADRLLQLVNQFLDLSKLEAGHLQVDKKAGEIITFLDHLAGSFESLFESKEIIYQYALPAEPIQALFDADKVEKVLTNLLFNAFKFTAPGGKVNLRISAIVEAADRSQLELIVQDTGIGISKEQIPHIFKRFYQADASAMRSYEGTGIGLALVKELVELQEGTISVSSTIGVGTTFKVLLPLQLVTPEEIANPREQEVEPKQLENEIKPTTAAASETFMQDEGNSLPGILVVEDNADLRYFILGSLIGQYRVQEAANGQTGYELALEKIPDLIISDIMMPGMDGLSLCEKLKTNERTSHIPVILLTARADMGSKLAGLETGADDYLTKPFQVEELQMRIRNLIEMRRKLRERYRRSLTLQPSEVVVTSLDEKFLQKVISILEANLSNSDFDVEMFSREIGMSRVQLHRKLKALTDQSASEFVRTFRLKRAASLLEQQAGNISEVADSVGFNSIAYFTKCFKEHFGQKPSEFIAALNENKSTKPD
ncbi:hybrid sensor histidine kinase/response regulator transcription factor [Adhaeribacter radiodurans]|uniref:histidine kinase n=1 Tax=Adhaeribacter radiodurans TaxID=2745197 RepID=A0A7L7L5T7_9BACT|nr:ATP-binding protein [Adhaeribacter radiodurans]QMU28182.1 response regulator [Adhaeribacter radiodurans]